MSIDLHGMALVAVVAAVTMLISVSPFLVFGGGRPPGSSPTWPGCCPAPLWPHAGGLLPAGRGFSAPTPRLPERLPPPRWWVCIAGKNALLSIAAGTALYMVLVQVVFV